MIAEMSRKSLDLKRITKTAALLLLSGLSNNSIPASIIERCLKEQQEDGGWISTTDTLWNAYFLHLLDPAGHKKSIEKALDYIVSRKNRDGLWGRSGRDISRIPVTGTIFYLFPDLADKQKLLKLEQLWQTEKNSLTYKAGYILMAFKAANYNPGEESLTADIIDWLISNQRENGGYAPWKNHPVQSDVFCTSIATLGMTKYKEAIPSKIFKKSYRWLIDNRLPSGVWPYHEIEDGASWGLYTLTQLIEAGIVE
jgi:squalene cyclase